MPTQLDSVPISLLSPMEPSITPEPDASSLNSPLPAEFDLYTIPSSSGWFDWNSIHETERKELKEFFNSSSLIRNPKVYKEYRDFMIRKYREEPEISLRFSDVRKALVGDVTLLRKVFVFLEKWGLINFGLENNGSGGGGGGGGGRLGGVDVRVEEGAPIGVKMVAVTGAGKALTDPLVMAGSREVVDGGFEFAPLASYNDVFGEVGKKEKKSACVSCGRECASGDYKSKEGSSIICKKCFESKNYGEGKSADDVESNDAGSIEVIWTEEETLNLLESVLKHGDDWELVTQGVKNKNKLDCIAKLITLPLGEFVMGSNHGLVSPGNSTENNVKDGQTPSSKPNAIVKMEDTTQEEANKPVENGDTDLEDPPMKKWCIDGSSIMKQVALIAKMVNPHITAAATEAAVTALWNENPDIKELFDIDEDPIVATDTLTPARSLEGEDTEMKDVQTFPKADEISPENSPVPIALRYRAATATALGAAAARAKMLADQEEKESEHLMAIIIDNQLKKLACKMKVLVNVQQVLEKENTFIAEQEDCILSERINVVKRAFDMGITRPKDHSLVKQPSHVVQ